jgi:hypothetical protein
MRFITMRGDAKMPGLKDQEEEFIDEDEDVE